MLSPCATTRQGRSSSPHISPGLADARSKWTNGETVKNEGGKLIECDFSESQPKPANTLNASIRKKSTQQENTELVTGKCETCGSLLRWPRHLNLFRCTVCLMVNHVKSKSAKPTNEDGLRAEWQADKGETKTFNQKLGMLGVETTFFPLLIIRCSPTYISFED